MFHVQLRNRRHSHYSRLYSMTAKNFAFEGFRQLNQGENMTVQAFGVKRYTFSKTELEDYRLVISTLVEIIGQTKTYA